MQQQVKSKFEALPSHVQAHPFAKELHKKAKLNAKRLEEVLQIESKITSGGTVNAA